jgi:hypothetical protein
MKPRSWRSRWPSRPGVASTSSGRAAGIQDYPGDNARQAIVTQYDGRLPASVKANFSEYDNPAVNRLIDRALAEPDRARRAALWGRIDRRIMRDAPMVPLMWENYSFEWASRVHGWRYDPWATTPDLTAVWLDPPPIDTPSAHGGLSAGATAARTAAWSRPGWPPGPVTPGADPTRTKRGGVP